MQTLLIVQGSCLLAFMLMLISRDVFVLFAFQLSRYSRIKAIISSVMQTHRLMLYSLCLLFLLLLLSNWLGHRWTLSFPTLSLSPSLCCSFFTCLFFLVYWFVTAFRLRPLRLNLLRVGASGFLGNIHTYLNTLKALFWKLKANKISSVCKIYTHLLILEWTG